MENTQVKNDVEIVEFNNAKDVCHTMFSETGIVIDTANKVVILRMVNNDETSTSIRFILIPYAKDSVYGYARGDLSIALEPFKVDSSFYTHIDYETLLDMMEEESSVKFFKVLQEQTDAKYRIQSSPKRKSFRKLLFDISETDENSEVENFIIVKDKKFFYGTGYVDNSINKVFVFLLQKAYDPNAEGITFKGSRNRILGLNNKDISFVKSSKEIDEIYDEVITNVGKGRYHSILEKV